MPDHRRRVLDAIDAMRPEIVRFLQELIRRPSENTPPSGHEGPCQAFIAETLRAMGLEVDVFRPDEVAGATEHPEWLPGRLYINRPNVVGVRAGTGGGRSLLLLGHADVEPAGPRALWRHDPWGGEVEDGQVYGRGAGDDKGGICAAVMALEALRRCGVPLRGRVTFASVVDEEQGGGNGTVAVMARGYHADAGIYVDGIGLRGELAYLGGGNFVVRAQQRGDYRPIEDTLAFLGRVCRALIDFGEQRYRQILTFPGYEDNTAAGRGFTIAEARAGDTLGNLTRGGEVSCWGYALPSEKTPEEMLAVVRAHLAAAPGVGDDEGFAYELSWRGRFLHSCLVPATEDIVATLAGAYRDATGKELELGSAEMSDAPLMNRYGAYPTIGFGVARWLGEGAAHSPDEAVSIDDELIPACRTLALAIMDWCGVDDD